MDPQHPVKPAFDRARDFQEHQRQLLSDEQRRRYDDLKKKQEEEVRVRQTRIAFVIEQIEKTINKQHQPRLQLNPPGRTINLHLAKLSSTLRQERDDLQNYQDGAAKARNDYLMQAQRGREDASMKQQSRTQDHDPTAHRAEFNAKARADRNQPQPLQSARFNRAASPRKEKKAQPEPLHTKKIAASREQDNLRQQQMERAAANKRRQARER